MNKEFIYRQLLNILDEESIKVDELMKKHITFKVGGPADFLVKPKTEEELRKVIKFAKEENIPFLVIGNGSNLLVKDGGIRGIVIELSDNFNNYEIEGNIIKSQSGALAMNAGAYGGEMKQVVKSVRLMDTEGNIFELSNEEMEFEYRKSLLSRKDYIVLSAVIELQEGNMDKIKETMADYSNKRVTKQPLNLPSAGSTFKRPEGHFAAKLIDDCGLRGLTLRGAQVSDKHCGFVVNMGDANAKDILDLMFIVKSTVNEKFGIMLEEEVKILGED